MRGHEYGSCSIAITSLFRESFISTVNRRAQNHPTVHVVCGIIEYGNRFLAAQRAKGDSNGGLWEFPGGKIRENEALESALVRELEEELGIRVNVGKRLRSSEHDYPTFRIVLIPFVCTIERGDLAPTEHQAIRWLLPRQARELEWCPADVPILEEYLGRCYTPK